MLLISLALCISHKCEPGLNERSYSNGNRYCEDIEEEASKNGKCEILCKMRLTGLHNYYDSHGS